MECIFDTQVETRATMRLLYTVNHVHRNIDKVFLKVTPLVSQFSQPIRRHQMHVPVQFEFSAPRRTLVFDWPRWKKQTLYKDVKINNSFIKMKMLK